MSRDENKQVLDNRETENEEVVYYELKSFNDDASQQDSENQQDNTADAQNYENGYSDLYKEYINKSEKQV